jgi:hypothetical protein
MAGIVFFFEENDVDLFSGRRIDLSAWNYAIKSAGDIDRVIVVNRTNMNISSFDSELTEFRIEREIPVLTGKVCHIICPWDTSNVNIPLWDFDHDVDWYLFGPAAGWRKYGCVDFGVSVPMSGRGALHAVHIASTIMLHRFGVKKWQRQQ